VKWVKSSMKETYYLEPPLVDTGEGPHTSECTKSKGAREEEIILLKGKANFFFSVYKHYN